MLVFYRSYKTEVAKIEPVIYSGPSQKPSAIAFFQKGMIQFPYGRSQKFKFLALVTPRLRA